MVADQLKTQIQGDGFAIIPACLESTTLESLSAQFDELHDPERNLLSIPSIQALATSTSVRKYRGSCPWPRVLRGSGNFLQQDADIELEGRLAPGFDDCRARAKAVDGFGPWTTKAGVLHVQPPS